MLSLHSKSTLTITISGSRINTLELDCFVDRPGLYHGVKHRIEVTPEFKAKQMKPYRVPQAFRAEVDRQIQELLDLGLITPLFSSMASPIVCIAKKDGGVRIACDYRYVNKFTVGDAYPMPTVQETIRSLGNDFLSRSVQ